MEIVSSPDISHAAKAAPSPDSPLPLPRNRAPSLAVLWDNAQGQEPSFYLKRLEEMRKCRAELDEHIRELASTYVGVTFWLANKSLPPRVASLTAFSRSPWVTRARISC